MFANFSSMPMCAHFNVFTMISFWLRLHIVVFFCTLFLGPELVFNSSKAFGAGRFECHEYCIGLGKFGLGFVQDFQNKPPYKTKIL